MPQSLANRRCKVRAAGSGEGAFGTLSAWWVRPQILSAFPPLRPFDIATGRPYRAPFFMVVTINGVIERSSEASARGTAHISIADRPGPWSVFHMPRKTRGTHAPAPELHSHANVNEPRTGLPSPL